MQKWTVNEAQEGETITGLLLGRFPELRLEEAQRILKKGGVKVDGVRMKKDVPLVAGDVIEVYPDGDLAAFAPEAEVVYEDENLMIFNKPAGIQCVSDKMDGKPTLYSLAVDYMRSTGEYEVNSLSVPYICHRLDIDTGGLVIVAKNQLYFEELFEALKQRRIRRFYKAVVCGPVGRHSQATLHDYMTMDGGRGKVFHSPGKNTAPIATRYSLVKTNGELSLLDVELVTARPHQARAHLASAGFPVLGDEVYGNRRMNKKYDARYEALWADKIIFETGTNNLLEYLNKKEVSTQNIVFPYVDGGEE